jgi:hypothetical protein
MTYRRGTERNLHEYLFGTADRKRDDRKKKTSKKVPYKRQKLSSKESLERALYFYDRVWLLL